MICLKKDCTGCFSCVNVCPKNAINMQEDSNGFIYPLIDENKCINCKMCERVCQGLHPLKLQEPIYCYAMHAKDEKKWAESTSGGAATIFYESILKQNGVVYGVNVKNINEIGFERILNAKELYKFKGSKYVHSYINLSFRDVKEDLLNNKKVLFIGTPCQIAGLKLFLQKDYDNLYLVDLICHGVPSQKYLRDELNNTNVTAITFRENNEYYLSAYNDDKLIQRKYLDDSIYYSMFMRGLNYRENCYSCKFATKDRCSDITIGDFWGVKSDSTLYNVKDKGLSVLLINTKKGEELINISKSNMVIEKRNIQEAVNGNSQLRAPIMMNKRYYKYKNNYQRFGYLIAYKKTFKYIRFKNKLKKNFLIKKMIKLIR